MCVLCGGVCTEVMCVRKERVGVCDRGGAGVSVYEGGRCVLLDGVYV